MEKQGTMRAQVSKRSLAAAPASFTASRRGESMQSLAGTTNSDDRTRTVATLGTIDAGEATAAGGGGATSIDDLAGLYGGIAGSSNGTTSKRFDLAEALGPSLLEVLTLVRPSVPPSHQSQQQDAGEDAGENNHTASYDELQNAALVDPTATFDVCLSRSAIVARVVDASVDNTRRVQEFFARTLETLKCEATGLVLLQESTVLVFLETTADEFLKICEQLVVPQQTVLDHATLKVLASCDDNAVRLLQGLYFRKIAITRGATDAAEWTDDALRQISVDTFLNLIKFVKKIGPLPPTEIRKVLTTLANSDQVLLPSNELLLWLLARDEVMPLSEFLELFHSPIMLELESERVWPVHPLITY